jgi:hypothetical protein
VRRGFCLIQLSYNQSGVGRVSRAFFLGVVSENYVGATQRVPPMTDYRAARGRRTSGGVHGTP